MDKDRQTALSLNTDRPPDQLGDNAFDCRNVVASSDVSMAPRWGTKLEGHFNSATLGRQIVVVQLPHRTDTRLLVVMINTTEVNGSPISVVEGLAEFAPKTVGGTTELAIVTYPGPIPWDEFGDQEIGNFIYGWVES